MFYSRIGQIHNMLYKKIEYYRDYEVTTLSQCSSNALCTIFFICSMLPKHRTPYLLRGLLNISELKNTHNSLDNNCVLAPFKVNKNNKYLRSNKYANGIVP